MPRPRLLQLLFALIVALRCAPVAAAEPDFATAAAPLFKRYCFDCHGSDVAEGQIQLAQMTAEPAFNTAFKKWEKVAAMLEAERMPPKDAPQPTKEQRQKLAGVVRRELHRAAEEHGGDPGEVVLRRLTSAEYAYTIQDLTGLDLDLEREFVSDAAGGEGFTNLGSVQFLDDAGLERYLEAAKKVAAHAVIGAGALQFFPDPGKTGFELSAIHRINQIYRDHGFRTAAGEGGEPFGLGLYPKAFFAAWRYQHRAGLGLGDATIERLAAEENLPPRFAARVWSVLATTSASFPTSDIVARWRRLPVPEGGSSNKAAEARAACEELYRYMTDLQMRLAKAVGDEEEAAVLSENTFEVAKRHAFTARFPWIDPPANAHVTFSVLSGDPSRTIDPVITWRNPRLRFRRFTRRRDEPQPLAAVLSGEAARAFGFGQHPRGGAIGSQDFVTIGATSRTFELPVPEGARGLEILVDAELDLATGEDCVVRCSIIEDGEDAAKAKTVSALLADPDGKPFQDWKTGVVEFARLLPQVSHREPAPSDRDPIPFPFDNTYNAPERDFFHSHVKYHRDDAFFVANMLDESERQRLDEAWADLLTSFEYHDILLRFVAEKFKLDLAGRSVGTLNDAWIERLPAEVREYVSHLRDNYRQSQERRQTAEPRHLADCLAFASQAWRRPLADDEKERLLAFYRALRRDSNLDHPPAVRALLARILVAPEFLYRTERRPDRSAIVALTDWELASRLSYLVWSSMPDDELRRAATAGELRDPEHLARQARRMLRDPRARRLATEFFGQWLGFYQFDRFRGIDPERFPEFSDRLKTSLYDEAICFFENFVRESRPVKEILFADYAFLNDELARHYAIDLPASSARPTRVEHIGEQHRGGLLGLGAVLTVTSAPLRTSPVKRGDWILRRVLGTPVPPPPANAGSIAADDASTDGKSVRQRLEAHRREPSCVNCHSRIDPLGFALEHYDPLGRWRATYRGGEAIDDSLRFGDAAPIAGREGLIRYLQEHQGQFYDTLVTKLLAYSLGRGELASDRELTEKMKAEVNSGDGSIADLVVTVVTSKQFRNRRGQATNSAATLPEGKSHGER